MVLLIDNYDSFSYNLYQLIGEYRPDIRVIRNDQMTVEEIRQMHPDRIVLSPGPGRPENAGIIVDVVRELGETVPLLGVCLGHQAICTAFGARITYARRLMHGKQSIAVFDRDCIIFRDCPEKAVVGRYHSLSLLGDTLPDSLQIISKAKDDGEIMAVKHKDFNVYGLQFHPESILTPDGLTIIKNFIEKVNRGIL